MLLPVFKGDSRHLGIYIPGFILGLGASFMTAYKFYMYVLKKEKKTSKKFRRKGVYFNKHI